MGRFKIYDPKSLVIILNDTNYAKCLICEKTLKNIMGNIKRHYEQVHDTVLDANIERKSKSKMKSSRTKAHNGDYEYKPTMKRKKSPQTNTNSSIIILDKKETIVIKTPTLSSLTASAEISALAVSQEYNNTAVTAATAISNVLHKEVGGKHCVNNFESPGTCRENKLQYENLAWCNVNKGTEQQIPTYNSNYLQNIQNQHERTIVNTETKQPTNNTNGNRNQLSEANNLEEKFKPHTLSSKISNVKILSLGQNECLKCLVELKTEFNFPLKNFRASLTDDIDLKFGFNEIADRITGMIYKLRREIKKIVGNRLIYLKLDIANVKDRKLMLVNLQFIRDFEIKVFTISVLELLDDTITTNLEEKALNILKHCEISNANVYSITRDYADSISDFHSTLEEDSFQRNEKEEILVQPFTSEYCHNLCEKFPGHAMHFVAYDVINMLHVNIIKCYESANSLRTKMFTSNAKILPVHNKGINWFSIYDVIKSLLTIREKVEYNGQLSVDVDWIFVTKFVESFKPIVDTALVLQSNKSIMGDLYREWLVCEMELEELFVNNEIAAYLLEALRKRKMLLFENILFLSALYLDPRFCYMGSMHLSDKQKKTAIGYLQQIFNKLKSTQQIVNNSNLCSSYIDDDRNKRYLKLEKKFSTNMVVYHKMKIESTTHSNNSTTSLTDVDCHWIEEALEHIQFGERQPFHTDVLDYWKISIFKNPVIARIVEVSLAAPATQATINSALKVLSLMSKKYEANVSKDNLENILLFALNQDLIDKISIEE